MKVVRVAKKGSLLLRKCLPSHRMVGRRYQLLACGIGLLVSGMELGALGRVDDLDSAIT